MNLRMSVNVKYKFDATIHCTTLQKGEYSTHWGTLGTLGLNIALFGCICAHEEYWWKYIYN